MTKSPTQSLKYTKKNAKTIIVRIVWFKHIYCQIYTMGLNTSFTTYIQFSPVSYMHRSDRERDG